MKNLEKLGVDHVGFVVRDLDAALGHFKQWYGIEAFQVYDFSPSRAWSDGEEVYGYRLRIAMAGFGGRGGGIEVIQPVAGRGVHQAFVDAGHSGLHHIAFAVDDFDHWRGVFVQQGARFIFESETEDELIGYRRCFYAQDATFEMIYEIKETPYFRTGGKK